MNQYDKYLITSYSTLKDHSRSVRTVGLYGGLAH